MPQIELIPDVYYTAMMPYNVDYDNLPLRNIIQRQELINTATDINTYMMLDAIGSQGTLGARLARSLHDDGTLISTAIDNAMHHAGSHQDDVDQSGFLISGDQFIRMTERERDKLELIADEATSLKIKIQTPSIEVDFIDEILEFAPSDTITWTLDTPSSSDLSQTRLLRANMAFPPETAHRHYYGLAPYVQVAGNYKNFKNTYTPTPYNQGSLRVYINGTRIFSDCEIYVPNSTQTNWTLNGFTDTYTTGLFSLTTAITAADNIRIDFDIALA